MLTLMATGLFGPNTEVIDVTAPLSPTMAVWPGDATFELEPTSRISRGAPCNVSRVSCSSHAGTHVDAPWHFEDDGARLDDIPAERWIGRCWVVETRGEDNHITAEDLKQAKIPDGVVRLIIRTRDQLLPVDAPFDTEYRALTPDAARWLVDRRLDLIGIDTPSVEPFDDDAHLVHHTLLGAGVLIVEGLELSAVEPGPYIMVCLPLRLVDADGSPARALLIREA